MHQIELEMQNEELRRAREEVEEALARYTDLYDRAPVGYLSVDRGGAILEVNLTGARLLGVERSRLFGSRLGELVSVETRPAFDDFLSTVLASGTGQACEVVLCPRGAAPVDVELTGVNLREGRECRIVAMDVTGRRRADKLLAVRRRLLALAPAGTPCELLQAALDEAERLTGSTVGLAYLVEPDGCTLALQAWTAGAAGVQRAGRGDGSTARVEAAGPWAEGVRLRRAIIIDGSGSAAPGASWSPAGHAPVEHQLVAPVIRRDRVVALVGVGRKAGAYSADDASAVAYVADVAWEAGERAVAEQEREALRAQLAQSQKMEAIGTLAGGIAHDFNNILGGILGGLSLLDLELGPDSDHHGEITDLETQVERGADLTRRLLGFAHRGKYDPRPLDLGLALASTCAMFERTRKDLTLERVVAPDLRPVLMDRAQLEQVLLNLLVNAGQAMPDGGRITLRAANVELGAEEVAPHGARPGRFVRLVVADTGVGMSEATRARVFEPFFTTKRPGEGSGLGLASVFGILKSHGAFVTVESEEGKGSSFTLHLPTTEEPRAEEAPAAARPIQRGEGTILVVDDEEQIRRVCSRLLEAAGYDVLVATCGAQALDIARERGRDIALVVLDMIMPDLGGRQVYEALQKISPGLKVLVCSGFSSDGQVQELLARGCNDFLQKPFDAAALTAKVRELL